jgi:hypothetical protein
VTAGREAASLATARLELVLAIAADRTPAAMTSKKRSWQFWPEE